MEINLNTEAVRSFLGRTKDKEGNEYSVKVVVFKEPIATNTTYGNVKSGAFLQSAAGEIIYPMLFPDELTDEQMNKQGNYMVSNVDKILESIHNG